MRKIIALTALALVVGSQFTIQPASAGLWDKVKKVGRDIDPTNRNGALREGLRNVDPTTGDIYVKNNSSYRIRVRLNRATEVTQYNPYGEDKVISSHPSALNEYWIFEPFESAKIKGNVSTGLYNISAEEVSENGYLVSGGAYWDVKSFQLKSNGFTYTFR